MLWSRYTQNHSPEYTTYPTLRVYYTSKSTRLINKQYPLYYLNVTSTDASYSKIYIVWYTNYCWYNKVKLTSPTVIIDRYKHDDPGWGGEERGEEERGGRSVYIHVYDTAYISIEFIARCREEEEEGYPHFRSLSTPFWLDLSLYYIYYPNPWARNVFIATFEDYIYIYVLAPVMGCFMKWLELNPVSSWNEWI